jgi:hypothetical protein
MATREYVLQRLAAERRQAEQCFEWQRVAEIDAQVTRLSAGAAVSPAKETTAARRPARSKA